MASGNGTPAADITAEPEYSGTLSILTKFAGEPLGPYFETLAAEYEELHPEVSVELIQETDQSVYQDCAIRNWNACVGA